MASGERPGVGEGAQRPQTIGRYVLEDELGRGGMGVVYRAFDPELGRRVALKVLLGGALVDEDLAERFRREARAVARLDHPNIVRVLDLGRTQGQLFFTMDCVEGPSLATAVEARGRFPVAEAIRIIAAVARGLEHAHRAGVIHRDIKPGNILLEPDGTPRITDFGLALEMAGGSSRLTRTGQVMGTPAYMSPEQGRADVERISARSDIYSLGAVLYQLLTGRPPHVAEGDLVVLYMAIHDPVPSPRQFAPELSRELETICLRALAREPEERYPSAQALAEDLERFGRGEPIRARRPSIAVRVGRALRRRGRAALLAGAMAVAVAAAIAAGMASPSGSAADRSVREAAAHKRMQEVEARIDELTRAGRLDEADEAFEVFSGLDENWGTRALARALLTRAARQRELGRFDRELVAAGAAYAHARAPELRGEALLGLARAFARRWWWDRIDPILDALEAHPARREAASLRAAAALARRDLGAALESEGALPPEVRPLLAALAPAQKTPHRAVAASPAPIGPGGAPRLLLVDAGDRRRVIVARPAPGLPAESSRRLAAPIPGDRDLHVLSRGGAEPVMLLAHHQEEGAPREAALYRWSDSLAPAHRWQEDALNAAAAVDVDGDGTGEIYIGLGPYRRKLYRLVERGGTWARETPHAATNREESDILALAGVDLDGDGARELAASVGPWRSFDVRVLREDREGAWETLASRRLGFVGGLAALPGEGGDLLVATKSQVYPSAEVFTQKSPYGEPPGVYLLRLEGRELARAASLPIPFPEGSGHAVDARRIVTGDFDGDGLVDFTIAPEAPSLASRAILFRRTGESSFAPVTLGGLEVLAAIDVDDDPADELVAALPDRGREVWILGAGKERAPPLSAPALSAPAPPPLRAMAEPALLGTWGRAEELVSFGLFAEAALVFEHLARRARLSETAAAAELRAAELFERAGKDDRAAPLFERAARDAGLAGAALEGAVREHMREHHFDRALSLARELGRQEGAPEGRARWGRETEAILEELVAEKSSIEIDFAAPLAGAWEILDPVALRRDARAQTLRVDAFGTRGSIARLPFSWSGGRLGLEIDLEVERSEWAAGFGVALRKVGGAPGDRIGVGVFGWGGGGILRRQVGCLLPGQDGPDGPRRPVAGPAKSEQVRARIELAPALDEILCVLSDGAGNELHRRRIAAGDSLSPGAYELVFENLGDPGIDDPRLSVVRIDRIAIAGGEAAPSRDDPLQLGHRAVVEGDGAAALQLYDFVRDPGGEIARQRDLGRILAYGDLGMQSEARERLRALGIGGAGAELARLLRTRERQIAPLAREVLGPRYFARYLEAWRVPIVMHLEDDSVRMSLTTAVAGLREALPSEIGPRGAETKMLLLRARGEAWWYRGRYAAARADLASAAELADLLARRAKEAGDPEGLRVAEQVLEEAKEILERMGGR